MATSPFVTSDSDDRELLTLTEELERAIHPPSQPTHTIAPPLTTTDSDDRELVALTEEVERATHPPSQPTHSRAGEVRMLPVVQDGSGATTSRGKRSASPQPATVRPKKLKTGCRKYAI